LLLSICRFVWLGIPIIEGKKVDFDFLLTLSDFDFILLEKPSFTPFLCTMLLSNIPVYIDMLTLITGRNLSVWSYKMSGETFRSGVWFSHKKDLKMGCKNQSWKHRPVINVTCLLYLNQPSMTIEHFPLTLGFFTSNGQTTKGLFILCWHVVNHSHPALHSVLLGTS
jgi:hypothetical protein